MIRSLRRGAFSALLVVAFALVYGTAERGKLVWPGFSASEASTPSVLIHYIGRFDMHDAAGARFGWPGTAIAATFTGTGIDAKLRDSGTNFFTVVIDGAEGTPLSTSAAMETYALASGLSPGRHTLVLTKRTESFVGTVQLLALTPRGGSLVSSRPPFTRRIEYIGDSVTCGYGDRGANQACHFSADTEDETLAYGALVGKELNAAVSVIAYSGIGMYRSFSGSTGDQMPVLFERTLASEPTPWSFKTPEPDVVVVNLGDNDFAKGDPGDAFERAYVAFLQHLRAHYPNARVVCALNAMLSDTYPPQVMARTKASAATQRAVEERNAAGDARVSYFAFDERRATEGFGCDYHPSVASHQLMAAALGSALRTLMGW
jgi:lysophospholipase L1-like esterase